MPIACASVRCVRNSTSDQNATNSGPADWISSAFSAVRVLQAVVGDGVVGADAGRGEQHHHRQVGADLGQSARMYLKANGSSTRNAPLQRRNASVTGGMCPVTKRATTTLPAQNSEVRLSSR